MFDINNLNTLIGISPWSIIKFAVLILLAFYLIFAFVIIRQVRVMTSTLDIGLEVFLLK